MCIVIIYCPVCDVINFEIKHSFLIKTFSYITKKLEQKSKCLENENNLQLENILHQFYIKVLSVVRNCLRPESGLLIDIMVSF